MGTLKNPRNVYGVGARPYLQLVLQSACASMCRHNRWMRRKATNPPHSKNIHRYYALWRSFWLSRRNQWTDWIKQSNFVLSGRPVNKESRTGLWYGCHIFDFTSETSDRMFANLVSKQVLNIIYQVPIRLIHQQRLPESPLIDWRINES